MGDTKVPFRATQLFVHGSLRRDLPWRSFCRRSPGDDTVRATAVSPVNPADTSHTRTTTLLTRPHLSHLKGTSRTTTRRSPSGRLGSCGRRTGPVCRSRMPISDVFSTLSTRRRLPRTRLSPCAWRALFFSALLYLPSLPHFVHLPSATENQIAALRMARPRSSHLCTTSPALSIFHVVYCLQP